jgi:hypothetical protein
MRVVSNAAAQQQRRRGDPVTIDGTAETVAGAAGSANDNAAVAAPGLPILGALLFLVACIGGGVAVAVLRPFGIG